MRHRVVVFKLKHLLHNVLHLVGVHYAVHHLALYKQVGRLELCQFVGIRVERVDAYAAALAYCLAHVVPHSSYKHLGLQAVGIAHVLLGICLCSALESSHLHHLELYAELGEQVLVEYGLSAYAVPFEHALRIDVHLVGSRRHVVGALRV